MGFDLVGLLDRERRGTDQSNYDVLSAQTRAWPEAEEEVHLGRLHNRACFEVSGRDGCFVANLLLRVIVCQLAPDVIGRREPAGVAADQVHAINPEKVDKDRSISHDDWRCHRIVARLGWLRSFDEFKEIRRPEADLAADLPKTPLRHFFTAIRLDGEARELASKPLFWFIGCRAGAE